MAQTTASALSQALTFKVQKTVLANLRAELVWADPAYAEMGDFDAGHDTLTFVAVPDITLNVTPLTEGTKPASKAMSITTVSVATSQYGDLVSITDLAKVKSPIDIANITAERVGRQAKESLDQVARDVIAASGTVKYGQASSVNAVRTDLATTDIIAASDLRRLRTQMYKGKIRPRSDGYYLIFIHPNVGFDLRNDTSTGGFIDVNKYATPDTILRGELGRMEGFRIIEVVNGPTFSSTTTVYASIAVGDTKAWGAGELQSLSTYHVAPGGDHADPLAQEELVGWKVSYGVAVLSNGYFFRLETAATSV